MCAENLPPPLVALASTEINNANMAWNAFDGVTSTNWLASTTTGWVQIDLGAGNGVIAGGYSVQACNASNLTNTMITWTFAGSNDGSTFTTLDTETGITWTASQIRTWTFANSTSYRYYRITATANNGGSLCGLVGP